MDTAIPSRTALKSQAKRLRATLSEQGKTISHGQSLEAIAKPTGHAIGTHSTHDPLTRHAQTTAIGSWDNGCQDSIWDTGSPDKLTLVFDEAVDVVKSEHFSNLRRQVNCTVGPDGRSSAKTSNGQAQMVLNN